MGFGKMLSGLFKKDDEQKAVGNINETKNATSDELSTNAADTQRSEPAAPEAGSSYQVNEGNASSTQAASEDKPANRQSGSGTVTEEKILEALSEVYDPEIPIDIVNLGLIYGVDIQDGKVMIRMTMTAPGCPASTQIAGESKLLVEELPGVKSCDIELVWDPPWDPSKMSEEAQQSFGMF